MKKSELRQMIKEELLKEIEVNPSKALKDYKDNLLYASQNLEDIFLYFIKNNKQITPELKKLNKLDQQVRTLADKIKI